MKVSDFTKRALKIRREERWRLANGWQKTEGDWRLHRGMMQDWHIEDVMVSADGKHILFRTVPNPTPYKPATPRLSPFAPTHPSPDQVAAFLAANREGNDG